MLDKLHAWNSNAWPLKGLLPVPSRGHNSVFLYFNENILGIKQELDVKQINHNYKYFSCQGLECPAQKIFTFLVIVLLKED